MTPRCATKTQRIAAGSTSDVGDGNIREIQIQFNPLSTEDRDNEAVVAAEIAGTFPGSPITVDYRFVIANEKFA
jgi:hypothetical protein